MVIVLEPILIGFLIIKIKKKFFIVYVKIKKPERVGDSYTNF